MKTLKLKARQRPQLVVAFLLITILVLTGYALVYLRAAQPAVGVEAESVTPVVGSARIISDSTASASKALMFSAASATGACPLDQYIAGTQDYGFMPPWNGVINGLHTRPDDPLAPDTCRAGVSNGVALTNITDTAFAAKFTNGGTVSGYRVAGCVSVNVPNVTIMNTEINCPHNTGGFQGPIGTGASGLHLSHVKITCTDPGSNSGGDRTNKRGVSADAGLYMENTEVTNCVDGIDYYSNPITVVKSWVHNIQSYCDGPDQNDPCTHTDTVQNLNSDTINGVSVFKFNVLENLNNQSGDLQCPDTGSCDAEANWLINNTGDGAINSSTDWNGTAGAHSSILRYNWIDGDGAFFRCNGKTKPTQKSNLNRNNNQLVSC